MKALDKIYVCATHPAPFWFSDKQIPNMIEYIRKDTLLEWINKARTIPHENAVARDLAFQEVVNYLVNEM